MVPLPTGCHYPVGGEWGVLWWLEAARLSKVVVVLPLAAGRHCPPATPSRTHSSGV